MTHWKPYRVLFRQGCHHFETLAKARDFIQNFESNKIIGTITVEKLNKSSLHNPGIPYSEVYDNYEVWGIVAGKWKVKKA